MLQQVRSWHPWQKVPEEHGVPGGTLRRRVEPVLLSGQGACVSLQASGWREGTSLRSGLGPSRPGRSWASGPPEKGLGKCRWLSGLGPCLCHAGLQVTVPALLIGALCRGQGFPMPEHIMDERAVSPAAQAL